MHKKNKEDIVEILGKKFEYVRIDNIKKNPVIFFEQHSVDLCIKAYEILKPKRIYISHIPFNFLTDPLFADLEDIDVSALEDTDISPLNALHNLKRLWFTYTPGYEPKGNLDFSSFPQLETLRFLWLNGTKNIAALKSIKSVFIENFPYPDLKKFSNTPHLSALEINLSKIESLDGVEKITKLKELKITGSSHIKSIDSLTQVSNKRLKKLEISSSNDFTGLEGLSNLTALQSLTFDGISHLDCATLEKNTALKNLSIKRVDKMTNQESLSKLTNLKSLEILYIGAIDNLNFLSDLPNLEKLQLLPWFVKVKKGYLPLIQKFRALNKLKTLFKWDEILDHLDEEGIKQYKEHFGDSPLEFIKKDFRFHCYEDYSEPYTEENCNKIDEEIRSLIDKLIKNADKTTAEKLAFFEETANALDKIDEQLELFATGEREYLWDTLDKIAEASGINVNSLKESDSENIYFKWPVF
ncbi:hypothetical protein [Allomuricauda sp. F6463D]|uniref:hypothetical protein n=1 Tax=Allomuricauda sp. F6463D TaxID=2926409 RepID=UPI001FF46826|nr:hypothetical protein [Muricauda sp. F6463D]MCK0159435.1 hypothetical protein [Muricauda sp. F6463D]